MKRREHAFRDIQELQNLFADRKTAIRQRLNEFASVRPEELYYELAYCLLTPQSSAVNAALTVNALKKAEFLSREMDPVAIVSSRAHYIRFHNTKARHLEEAKRNFPVIAAKLSNGSTGPELRDWLVEQVSGFGWKEASHFLRNIGHRDLAILDRHILRNLRRHGVIRSIPKSLTPKRYFAIEARFAAFASQIGISMDELDLLFWSRETGEILK